MSVYASVFKSYKAIKRLYLQDLPFAVWINENFYLIENNMRGIKKSSRLISKHVYETAKRMLVENKGAVCAETIICFFEKEALVKPFSYYELCGILPAIAAVLITDIGDISEKSLPFALLPEKINCLRSLDSLDLSGVFEAFWSPEKIFLLTEPSFALFDGQSKQYYREALAKYAKKSGISELDAAVIISQKAKKSGLTMGELLFTKSKTGSVFYPLCLLFLLAASLVIPFYCFGFFSFLFLPMLAEACFSVCDYLFSHFVKPQKSFSLALEKIPVKTVVAITALVTRIDKELLTSIERFYYLNRDENIVFCLLCDLCDSKQKTKPEDKEIFDFYKAGIDELNRLHGKRFCLFMRQRTLFGDGMYRGYERKRGALEELIKAVRNGDSRIIGASVRDAEFLLTLDSDTRVSADDVKSLVSAALHPQNRGVVADKKLTHGYGIFAPAVTTGLQAAYKTRFTRIISGSGGLKIYGQSGFDRQFCLFAESSFCGKGLIDVKAYSEILCDRLKSGRILSHDIIEGGYLKTLLVPTVTLTDSVPKNCESYFRRLHRWVRGDVQNIPFLFDKSLSIPAKFRILAALRRHLARIMPIIALAVFCFLPIGQKYALIVLLSSFAHIIVPFLLTAFKSVFTGGSIALRHYFTKARNSLAQAFLLFCFEAFSAFRCFEITLDASIRAIYRMMFCKKRLLEWVTASQEESKSNNGAAYFVSMGVLSSLFGILLFCFSPLYAFKAVGIVFLCYPLFAFVTSQKLYRGGEVCRVGLSESDILTLSKQAYDMWMFFEDTVSAKTHWLPPDNLQFSPVEATAMRTSPTNIGFYIASVLAARDFSFIDSHEMAKKLSNTLETLQSLEKYAGNLYNWYDLKTLAVIGNRFVSTVDSGNFVCILTSVSQGLREYAHEDGSINAIIEQIDKLCTECDLSVLYNESKRLFSIGLYENGRLESACYDMQMSEARLCDYYACALGFADKRHWAALSRISSCRFGYAGMLSFSGTMFEYMMPQLFLPLFYESYIYESARFCIYVQRAAAKNGIWGSSESGYYSLDSSLCYRYKANGAAASAARTDISDSEIFAPYASYLALCCVGEPVMKNLKALSELGMYGKYGLYEAYDMTDGKSACGVAVKSYMAHHVGMSILACANACKDRIFIRRFMRDDRMGAFAELLTEGVPAEFVLSKSERRRKKPKKQAKRSEKTVVDAVDLNNPEVSILTKNQVTAIISASGHIMLKDGVLLLTDTCFENYSLAKNLNVSFENSGEIFGCAPVFGGKICSFEKGDGVCAHISSGRLFSGRVSYSFCQNSPCFAISTRAESKREYSLCFSFSPVMQEIGEYYAHPAFSKLFVVSSFDSANKILVFTRRNREDGQEQHSLALGFSDISVDFEFCTEKSRVNAYSLNDVSDFAKTECNNKSGVCVDPLCLIKTEKLRGGRACLLIYSAPTVREAVFGIKRARKDRLYSNGFRNDFAEQLQTALLFPKNAIREGFCNAFVNDFWCFGISCDYPLIVACVSDPKSLRLRELLHGFIGLYSAFVRCELLIFASEDDGYYRPVASAVAKICEKAGVSELIGTHGGIFVFDKSKESQRLLHKAKHCCRVFCDIDNSITLFEKNENRVFETAQIMATPQIFRSPTAVKSVFGGAFLQNGGFCVDASYAKKAPFSYILSGFGLGSVITDKSLGFSFYQNSREKRICSFDGDFYSLENGERLFFRFNNNYYDICACASSAEYANGIVLFKGSVEGFDYSVKVFVCKKLPAKFIIVQSECKTGDIILALRPAMSSLPHRQKSISAELCGAYALFSCELSDTFRAVGFAGAFDNCAVSLNNSFCGPEFLTVTKGGGSAVFYMGASPSKQSSLAVISLLSQSDCEETAMEFANSFLPPISVQTKSALTDYLLNGFLPYQISACRFYARASFYQQGGAYGFRDQLQDCLALIYSNPKAVKTHILRACAHQYAEGDVMHWWHSGSNTRGVRTKCSDDLLWLPYVVSDYIKKTSDYSLLDIKIHYVSSSPLSAFELERYEQPATSELFESVYLHCLRALCAALKKGAHGLVLMGSCDWNDAFSALGAYGRGESLFSSFLFIVTVNSFLPIIKMQNDDNVFEHYREEAQNMLMNIEKHAFFGDRYARAFSDDGNALGVLGCGECEIDILSQAFACFAGADEKRVNTALETAYKALYDPKAGILKLFSPPFENGKSNVGYIRGYARGLRENGGQYTHAAIWGIKAFLKAGMHEQALEILDAINPALRSCGKDSRRYRIEPYVIAADIYSCDFAGRGGWSWYTGAASWYYKVFVENVLGIEFCDNFKKITVNPVIEYRAVITHAGGSLEIIASKQNKNAVQDGETIDYPLEIPSGNHVIKVGVKREAR